MPKISARLRLTSKNPLIFKIVLLGVGQPEDVQPVSVFASRIPLVGPSCKINGVVFVGVVPDQIRLPPVGVNGLFGPAVIAASLAGELEPGLPYVNLSVSEFLLIADVLGEPVAVTTGDGEAKVPSKEGLRVPDDWMRVDVGLKGIKSINKTALEGEASNRVAVAMPANPNNFKLVLVKVIFVMNFHKIYLHSSCGVGCS